MIFHEGAKKSVPHLAPLFLLEIRHLANAVRSQESKLIPEDASIRPALD